MKKILITLAIALAGFNFQSCSLHDDTDLFGQSAAERVDEAVKADKALLESASNGWILRYYTGQNYSGGGYTFLCKFEGGKVVVGGDAAEPSETARSSYDIVKDRGPVLTFNTYNNVLHALGTPTQTNVDGGQGDYEFIIMKTTNDSIYLKGKKWGNEMVMTRMPESQSWEQYLKAIATVDKSILYNNKVMVGNDSVAYASVDYETRRLTIETDNGEVEAPYYVTPDGIHLQSPVAIAGVQLSDLKFNALTNELADANSQSVKLTGFIPNGYKPIEFWEGKWKLVYATSASANPEYAYYDMSLEQYNAGNLIATARVDGVSYEFQVTYDRKSGAVSLGSHYTVDPTDTYYGLVFYGVSFKGDTGYFNNKGHLIASWNDSLDRAYFKWDGLGDYELNSFVLMAINSSYQPEYDKDGNYISMAQLRFLTGMERANK